MIVNKEVILQNFKDNKDTYRSYFSDAIVEIDQLSSKPKCGACVNKFFKKILNNPNCTKHLSVIFEVPEISFAQDVQDMMYTTTDKPTVKSKTRVEVYFTEVSNYKQFIEEYTSDKLVRSITPTYIQEREQIMITILWATYQ